MKKSSDHANVRIGWDFRNVYFAMETSDEKVITQPRPNDGPCWRDDVFEVFVDPAGRADSYYEIGVNPSGSYYDYFIVRRDGPGDPARFVNDDIAGLNVATRINPGGGWSLEMAIPWRGLRTAPHFPPAPQDVYRLNVGVCDNDGDSYTGSSIFRTAGHHSPTSYGYLRFDHGPLLALMEAEKVAARRAVADGGVYSRHLFGDLTQAMLATAGGEMLAYTERDVEETPGGPKVRRRWYAAREGYGRVELRVVDAATASPEETAIGDYL
ncbi:MAG TPA: hypothetical protein ENN09_00780, partial [Planctomycetes bacterium]|nr:hypothetical protein [Planctomycetota bacterium]